MNFGFIGGTPRGQSLLSYLISSGTPPSFAVILKEDEHEFVRVSSAMLSEAERAGIPARIDKRLRDEDYTLIQESRPEFVIVCGWRTLIDLSRCPDIPHGFIAAHDSLLPKYRGFAPLNWAIIEGETETGVTLFRIREGDVDSGEILIRKKVSIEPTETIVDVYSKIIDANLRAHRQLISSIQNGTPPIPELQEEQLATYACKRTPDDGQINWNESSDRVFNLIRALVYPYSGAFFHFRDKKYVVRSASPGKQTNRVYSGRIPGRVIASDSDGVEVLCGSGSILLQTLEGDDHDHPVRACEVIQSITAKLS